MAKQMVLAFEMAAVNDYFTQGFELFSASPITMEHRGSYFTISSDNVAMVYVMVRPTRLDEDVESSIH